MLDRFKLGVLLQWLILSLLSPAYEASSLGLTVHVVPLDDNGGKTVRAHFSVITPSPCPDLSAVCAAGEDCQAHFTSLPFSYTKPSPAWCVRQWQKTVPSNYNAVLNLGSNTEFYVSINADPKVRANNGKLNTPAFVALPPPLRASVNCPVNFHVSAKDLDGDKVQCRFARADKGECRDCTPHSFMELDEGSCTLTFTGKAAAAQYFIYLMAEDLIPSPPTRQVLNSSPLSSVPVHLSLTAPESFWVFFYGSPVKKSNRWCGRDGEFPLLSTSCGQAPVILTVEESSSSCSSNPWPLDGTPEKDSVQYVLSFQEVKLNANYKSDLESVSEIAVVGPPDLYRVGFASVGPLAGMTMGWIRSANNLTQLLPVCFVANTNSFQSELRCVWLYQRELRALPDGTELRCNQTEMSLLLPVTSLSNINLAELQLNSPTCPVTYNNTHLTAHIPLSGCGTKAVHSGSELVYTNTLKSVHHTMISRQPSLIVPLACRIPGVQVKGPQYIVGMPTERQTFGEFRVWIEFYLPGDGPLAEFTSTPKFRSDFLPLPRARREAGVVNSISINNAKSRLQLGEKVKQLDLLVMSNCSVERAEMIVTNCKESETEDFAVSRPMLQNGCMMSNNTLEIVTEKKNVKIYRLDVNTMAVTGTTMYVECKLNLCITTKPSDSCPNLCNNVRSSSVLVNSVFTGTYTVRSGPVSLVVGDYLGQNVTTTEKPITSITEAPKSNATLPTEPTVPKPTTTPGSTPQISSITRATTKVTSSTTTSQAPEVATSRTTGVILLTISTFLQMNILQ